MLYYLYSDKETDTIKILASNKTYFEVEKENYILCGCYGRMDYAKHWASYENGEITEQEHKLFLMKR